MKVVLRITSLWEKIEYKEEKRRIELYKGAVVELE